MGWWITLGILALLSVLPLGISASYDAGGALVRLIIGPLKLTLYLRPKKDKKPKQEKKKNPAKTAKQNPDEPEPEPAAPKQEAKPAEKSGGKLTDFLPLVKTVLDFLGDFRRKLRVNVLELKLILAADDPCDLALNYGKAWAAVGNLMPKLEQWLVIKKRNIEVECDFTASTMLVIARLDLTITLGRLLAAVFTFAFRAIVQFIKIMNKRKGGALNESKSS